MRLLVPLKDKGRQVARGWMESRRRNQSGRIDNSSSGQIRNVDRNNWIILILRLLRAYRYQSLSFIVDCFQLSGQTFSLRESSANKYPKILIYIGDRRSTSRNISLILFHLIPDPMQTERRVIGRSRCESRGNAERGSSISIESGS